MLGQSVKLLVHKEKALAKEGKGRKAKSEENREAKVNAVKHNSH